MMHYEPERFFEVSTITKHVIMKSLLHKRKLDPEFAAAEKVAEVNTPDVFCNICNTGDSYRTVKASMR